MNIIIIEEKKGKVKLSIETDDRNKAVTMITTCLIEIIKQLTPKETSDEMLFKIGMFISSLGNSEQVAND